MSQNNSHPHGARADACSDPIRNVYYATIHYIKETEYEKMISDFFGGDQPEHQSYAAATLDLDVDCSNHYILIKSANTTPDENGDVTVVVAPGSPPAIRAGFEGYYSIQLFRGVRYLHDPDTYEFSKAKSGGPGGNVCFVFRALKNGAVVYYGDLSSTFPR